jgi:rhamnose transport system permease protein
MKMESPTTPVPQASATADVTNVRLLPKKKTARVDRVRGLLTRLEFVPLILLILAFILGTLLSPYFLHVDFLLDSTSTYIEVGIMALGETLVMILADIDLSVAGTLALVGGVAGVLYFQLHIPMELAIPTCLVIGAALGLLNGVLVTRIGLPSLAVTLGTMALYRGAAHILLGDESLPPLSFKGQVGYPRWFVGIDRIHILGTPIPLPLVIFLALALILGLVLHKSVIGRWIYAIGTNLQAAYYSGIPVNRVRLLIFTISGFMSGLAGLIIVSRLGVSRYDHASGWELDAITAVVLGGTSIAGGVGSVMGTVLAFLLIVILRTGMGVANVKAESQLTVIGALLVFAVLMSNVLARFRKQR